MKFAHTSRASAPDRCASARNQGQSVEARTIFRLFSRARLRNSLEKLPASLARQNARRATRRRAKTGRPGTREKSIFLSPCTSQELESAQISSGDPPSVVPPLTRVPPLVPPSSQPKAVTKTKKTTSSIYRGVRQRPWGRCARVALESPPRPRAPSRENAVIFRVVCRFPPCHWKPGLERHGRVVVRASRARARVAVSRVFRCARNRARASSASPDPRGGSIPARVALARERARPQGASRRLAPRSEKIVAPKISRRCRVFLCL